MDIRTGEITIERIGKNNYDDFCRMIVWRTTGNDSGDISDFKKPETQKFLDKHNVLNSDAFYIFAARDFDRLVGGLRRS